MRRMKNGDAVINAAFRQRMDEIKEDIAAGRLMGYNIPPEIPEKIKNITAFNCVLLLLAHEARWN